MKTVLGLRLVEQAAHMNFSPSVRIVFPRSHVSNLLLRIGIRVDAATEWPAHQARGAPDAAAAPAVSAAVPAGGAAPRRSSSRRRRSWPKPMAVNVRAVGNVEASSTVKVRAQVSGELNTVEFTEGQDVPAGQLLFTIDPPPFASRPSRPKRRWRATPRRQESRGPAHAHREPEEAGLVAPADYDAPLPVDRASASIGCRPAAD